jgi:hypothetical protein
VLVGRILLVVVVAIMFKLSMVLRAFLLDKV